MATMTDSDLFDLLNAPGMAVGHVEMEVAQVEPHGSASF